ncbi:carboxypeptidase-like regulatory domain-containing protein [Dyadobacter sp. CY345]|uniref:carboxypeptidase-like regulatory domain-containing protein n=1 Tax=Dyadobacter sp. CY345 TaxID=2909335 RepID=UPI001F2CB0A8|nr:carboxypeptidase-like regulatory domain-containing protein [Dyadobacter sp. CY345]MCF2443522.1 carboxypeptidase-like regulatory domain-containing protein [Dyadobacter sp. CY345]
MTELFLTKKSTLSCLLSSFFFINILAVTSACKDQQYRTSSVYGHISDEDGNPVDSIVVTLHASEFIREKELGSVLSDENGDYEITADVPNGYSYLSVNSPFVKNPKFVAFYQGFSAIYKNDVQTSNCCNATVGERTKYDFKLMPK